MLLNLREAVLAIVEAVPDDLPASLVTDAKPSYGLKNSPKSGRFMVTLPAMP